MKKLISFAMVAFFSTSIFAQQTLKADKAHSQISFGIEHMGISEVEGLFRDFDAAIIADKEDFSDAKYKVNIDATSIDTGVEMRDKHLKSADFFNVEEYPTITFVGETTKKVGEGKYKVKGDLTLHGVTKPVTLDVWYRGTVKNPQSGEMISGFQITGTIDRSEFNLGSDFQEPVLSDEVRIKVDGEFKK